MSERIVSEPEFAELLRDLLDDPFYEGVGSVTGPGRSGAIAAVYASHMLRVPFIPFGANVPLDLGPILIVDTAEQTGKTIRKAMRRYDTLLSLTVFKEPPRVAFWYEAPKPQSYRHECRGAA